MMVHGHAMLGWAMAALLAPLAASVPFTSAQAQRNGISPGAGSQFRSLSPAMINRSIFQNYSSFRNYQLTNPSVFSQRVPTNPMPGWQPRVGSSSTLGMRPAFGNLLNPNQTQPNPDQNLRVQNRGGTMPSSSTPTPVERVRETLSSGNLAGAVREFNRLNAETPLQLRGNNYLEWAKILQRSARAKAGDQKILAEAAKAYKSGLPLVKGRARIAGYNNYASMLLLQKRSKEAIIALNTISDEIGQQNGGDQARYYYNLGRALEVEQPFEAIKYFRQGAEADPRYAPAAKAVIRVLLSGSPERLKINEATGWIKTLINRRDARIARDGLLRVIADRNWWTTNGFENVLYLARTYLVAYPPNPATFDQTWKGRLQAVAKSGNSTASNLAKELISAWTDDLPTRFEISTTRALPWRRFPTMMTGAGPRETSNYLKAVGDAHSAAQAIPRALSRYAVAWSADNTNVDAAIASAAVLIDFGPKLDPDGKLLERFTRALFQEKEKAYLGGDLPAILRFHTILGNIYQRLGRWGPRHDARSALFQWESALQINERLKRNEPDKSKNVPVLRRKFALALVKTGNERDALSAYIGAVEDALVLESTRLAKAYLKDAEKLADRFNLRNPRLQDLQRRLR